MSFLCAAKTAFPENRVPQREVAGLMARLMADELPASGILSVFRHARVRERRLMRPLPWYEEPRSLSERNQIYLEEGLPLLIEASARCLAENDCPPEAVDHLIVVSSSGLAAPSLDARLIDRMQLPRNTTRVPVWGLGCAGGVMGLGMAIDYLRAYPDRTVLVAALETCSLTFQLADTSAKNLIGCALFGDGAGAMLLRGSRASGHGTRMIDHATRLFPATRNIMGWQIVPEGFELILAPELPDLVRAQARALVGEFLQRHDLSLADIRHWVMHPGGPKVIHALVEALDVDPAELVLTEQALAEYGNLSSVSIIAVIEKWLSAQAGHASGPGLMLAFGPGFSGALVLFRV